MLVEANKIFEPDGDPTRYPSLYRRNDERLQAGDLPRRGGGAIRSDLYRLRQEGTKAPDYMKLNPNGRIPTIIVGQTTTSQYSRAGRSFGILPKNMACFFPTNRMRVLKLCNG